MTSHDMALRRSGRLIVTRATPSARSYSTVGVPDTRSPEVAGSVEGSGTRATVVPDPCPSPARAAGAGVPGSVAASVARPVAAIVSFRLGGSDGVAVEATKWAGALAVLGFDIRTVAGEGPVDRLLPGLAIGAAEPPTAAEVARRRSPTPSSSWWRTCARCRSTNAAAAVVAGVIRGAAGGAAPPRPALAAPAVRRLSAAARRSRLGPRHGQRAVAGASWPRSGSPPPWCATPSTSTPPPATATAPGERSG